jgi:F-type H+-transporting ATPase subunit b
VKPSVIFRSAGTAPAAVDNVKRYPHDAQERDMVNFPPMKQPVQPGKLRIGVVPDEWFQFMYNKTGVTGPYILFWGGLTTILSKEYFVPWVDTPEHIVFLGMFILFSKKIAPQIAAFLDKGVKSDDDAYVSELAESTQHVDTQIEGKQNLKSLPDANVLIHAAKRENIHLQLEAALRERMHTVHTEVKKRLDYQVNINNVHARVEREQAINYIIDGVKSSIGANQQKEAFNSGLAQLKALSQKHAMSI